VRCGDDGVKVAERVSNIAATLTRRAHVRWWGGVCTVVTVGHVEGRALQLARRAVHVRSQHVLGDGPVVRWIELVENDEEEIETREQRVGQADVLRRLLVPVVLAVGRIGRGQNAVAAIMDAAVVSASSG
jgi:hypothetical protein